LIDLKELERLKKTPLIASQRKQSLADHGRFGENEFSKKNPPMKGDTSLTGRLTLVVRVV